MRFLVLLLPSLLPLTGSAPSSHNTIQCPLGFHDIYGHCVQFRTQSATWQEMYNECFNVGADMVKLDDANFMYYLVKFIKENGLDGHHYWIGARDIEQEGVFRWTDGTEVKMGTPFWGDNGDQVQEPDGGTSQNCGFLANDDHFFMMDAPCVVQNGPLSVRYTDEGHVKNLLIRKNLKVDITHFSNKCV
ncbi:LOW QUALITY PROTEIN: C-type mannose receptor 2-like [Penaeus monodon]|uniref:LOW QUALITY PROTEIN: C-type mannose receptor 2-like n=1 Tax=Penaeus monodon TaxID=6687 RepID=UPI0018A7BF50|nr:LOW QUALITY PROTEIN: C-type mannose receptor 2-like [Penaeus monodon]